MLTLREVDAVLVLNRLKLEDAGFLIEPMVALYIGGESQHVQLHLTIQMRVNITYLFSSSVRKRRVLDL